MDALRQKNIALKAGVFVAIGLGLMMVTILQLGGDQIFFIRHVRYQTIFSEVQGLFRGSVVSIAGLPVGNVVEIQLTDDFRIQVTLQVEEKFAHRLTEGVIAEVRTQGALGDKYIYIKPGKTGAKPIPPESMIPSEESDLLKLLTSREDGMAKAIDLVKETHVLVTNLNQNGQPTKAMANLSQTAEKLSATLKTLDGILQTLNKDALENGKLKSALASLASVLSKIDKGQGSLGQLINDPSVHQNLKNILGGSGRGKFMKELMRETIHGKPGE